MITGVAVSRRARCRVRSLPPPQCPANRLMTKRPAGSRTTTGGSRLLVPDQGSQHAHGNTRGTYKYMRRVTPILTGQKIREALKGPRVPDLQSGRSADQAHGRACARRRAPRFLRQPGGQTPRQRQTAFAQHMAGQNCRIFRDSVRRFGHSCSRYPQCPGLISQAAMLRRLRPKGRVSRDSDKVFAPPPRCVRHRQPGRCKSVSGQANLFQAGTAQERCAGKTPYGGQTGPACAMWAVLPCRASGRRTTASG